jgi:hypothetical protein
MTTEFIIWGCRPNTTNEQVLVSEKANIKNLSQAENLCKVLESKHNCTKTRIQIIDFTSPFNFSKESLNK